MKRIKLNLELIEVVALVTLGVILMLYPVIYTMLNYTIE